MARTTGTRRAVFSVSLNMASAYRRGKIRRETEQNTAKNEAIKK